MCNKSNKISQVCRILHQNAHSHCIFIFANDVFLLLVRNFAYAMKVMYYFDDSKKVNKFSGKADHHIKLTSTSNLNSYLM